MFHELFGGVITLQIRSTWVVPRRRPTLLRSVHPELVLLIAVYETPPQLETACGDAC